MLPLTNRPRRLRSTDKMRRLVRETRLDSNQLICPVFVSEKLSARSDVTSMPGVAQLSLNDLRDECLLIADLGIPAILLFGIPDQKDELASQAYAENGIVQEAVRAIKKTVPDLIVITDVCLCEYTSHGHCGVVAKDGEKFTVLNDASVELLMKTAVSHAAAGADIIAPSDMMDGRIGAIRSALDAAGYDQIPVMSYASKF
ncbi:MAG: porphobilinogen synthase, partial [Verrucomicrobia bacterium]|nr:porphobilinogen synthase [Verrucomicrobiota bacterium]